jgi:hypothetical protein
MPLSLVSLNSLKASKEYKKIKKINKINKKILMLYARARATNKRLRHVF